MIWVHGVLKKRALRFEKAQQNASSIYLTENSQTLWTGEVKADFFKVVRKSDVTAPPPFNADEASDRQPKVKVFGVKGVFSTIGTHARDTKAANGKYRAYGPPICTIKLSYCTAKGLIDHKVLSPPLEDTRKRKSTTDNVARTVGNHASNPFKRTFKLMNELKKVNEQIDEMEAHTDSVLGKELQEKIIDNLKKTKVAIGKKLAEECIGTVENPLEISDSDSE